MGIIFTKNIKFDILLVKSGWKQDINKRKEKSTDETRTSIDSRG